MEFIYIKIRVYMFKSIEEIY